MKFLVVIPPYVVGKDEKGIRPNKAMLPVGPLSIASALLGKGHEVEVLDLVFERAWPGVIAGKSYDCILLSCHTVRNITGCKEVLAELKNRWGFLPYIVLGGNVCVELGVSDFQKLGLEIHAVVRGFACDAKVIDQILSCQQGDIIPNGSGKLPVPALDLLPDQVHERYLKSSEGKYPLYGFGTGCL